MVLGGTLDSAMLQGIYGDMNDAVLAGFAMNYGAEADYGRKKDRIRFLKIYDQRASFLRFDKDIFGLAFLGNTYFKGDSLLLEKNSLLSYRQTGIRMGFRKGRFQFSAGIHGISRFTKASMQNGVFYTSPSAERMDIASDAQAIRGISGKMNGYGIDVSAGYVLRLRQSENDSIGLDIMFSVEGLGISKMQRSRLNTWQFDRSITWQGADLQGLIAGDTNQLNELQAFADSATLKVTSADSWFFHPAVIHIAKLPNTAYTGVPDAIFGIRMHLTGLYYPYAYLGMQYVFKNETSAGIVAGFGGFGKFQVGAYTQLNIVNRVQVYLATDNLPGWFYGEMKSRSVQVGLRYFYKKIKA
jgi:hypothetical protein